ncbi:MAG: UDP-N-acetylmuramate--L-alanine ligase [Deltaproteobacteria bacterium]|nr:UDP-N-acetylmuramate--L-alanine ligase [Deltaproteobacteria bacterium]
MTGLTSLSRKRYHIHLVGIGGIGMSGIAEVLINLGYTVSGSDLNESEATRRLSGLGARIATGPHESSSVHGADVVVISSAVKPGNPEVEEALRRGIPVIPRAEMLAELMRLKESIGIAGSHGKTTTTSIVATVMAAGGYDPTIVLGGKLNAIGTNAVLGSSDWMVLEADESDGSFLKLTPTVAVITNIDPEHLDHYGSMEALADAFVEYANKVPFYGLAVLCVDHPGVQAILPRMTKRFVTYGTSSQADYRGENLEHDGLVTRFDLWAHGKKWGRVTMRMPGRHNALNALACLAVSGELGIPFDVATEALQKFEGVARRFTVRGQALGATLVDDYAHHPEEIRATLEAAHEAYGNRVIAVFQPHRYSRVSLLSDEFARSFNRADELIVTEIYAAGETPVEGVSGESLARCIRDHGHRSVTFLPTLSEVVDHLAGSMREGDVVITLGAGNVSWVLKELLAGGKGGAA